MSKRLDDASARAAILARLARLAPDDQRQWGKMTPHQAICHLNDSFRAMMGGQPLNPISTFVTTTMLKWVALRAPVRWPPGVKTRPEIDQERGGTRPVEFASDRRALEISIAEFARCTNRDLQPHPFFGRMSTADWQRWGYRHMDHHLRQFGA